MIGRLMSVALAVLTATAFADGVAASQATPEPAGGLPEVVWQLTEATFADGSSRTPDDPARYTVQFLADGRLAVGADCNRGRGSYEVDGANLMISPIATTRIGCPPDSFGAEFAGWLTEVASFAHDGEALVLTLRDGAGSLRFVPALTGVVWAWQRFVGGDDTEIVPDDPALYTIQFLDDGRVAVQADCNRGSGRYTADAPEIDISALATTLVGCPPGSHGDRFLRDLDQVVSYVFREGRLALALPVDSGIHLFDGHAIADEPATPPAG